MAQNAPRSSLARFLFFILWGIFSRIFPSFNKYLLYWGLKDGAFPEPTKTDPVLNIKALGQTFKTPVGVEIDFADSDKLIDALIDMGLGFGEFGPYTLEAQSLPQDVEFLRRKKTVVISSDGYPNAGLLSMIPFFVNRRRFPSIIGVNIASSALVEDKKTRRDRMLEENEDMQKLSADWTYVAANVSGPRKTAAGMQAGMKLSPQEEFEVMVQKIAPYCDYIAINITHPSADLFPHVADYSIMGPFLKGLKNTAKVSAPLSPPKIMLKIPLDLSPAQISFMGKFLTPDIVDGLIIAGPHIVPYNSETEKQYLGEYRTVLFGEMTKKRSTELVRTFYRLTGGKLPIIAVGGIASGQDAFDKMTAGASLVQVNSALFFKGPKVISDINKELTKMVKSLGYRSISQIVGNEASLD
ncbi:MAG: hypothetical protein LBU87_01780 [Lactobacillales bacterium]|jgi:dihydroorotate dehydrogenase|nr:hypothetical protein [Lactobacillales bacterium]